MNEHEPRMLALGWAPYLGKEDNLQRVMLLGREPRVMVEVAPAVMAMDQALIDGGYENPCDWIGSYNYRAIGGTHIWSTHAYGTAIDLDYGGDTDGDGDPVIDKNPHLHRPVQPEDFGVNCQILEPQVRAVEAIQNVFGEPMWYWLGWSNGDTMHFQINVRPERTAVDWSTVGGPMPSFAQWVEGWVEGQAEDPAHFRRYLTDLKTNGQFNGDVETWVALLDDPTNPEWSGFYSRTELAVWAK